MSAKRTNDELLAEFDDLLDEPTSAPKPVSGRPAKPQPKRAAKPPPPKPESEEEEDDDDEEDDEDEDDDEEEDPLADLKQQIAQRPGTPKVAPSSATTSRTKSPRRAGMVTPSSSESARTSEEKVHAALARKSGDSTGSFHQGVSADEERRTPQPAPAPAAQKQSGGGWWGGLLSTATAAVKQAEAAVKEIQKNEEAQRWANQVRGNVGALKGIGGELKSRALPTFTTLLHTLAPPISQHERLQIHITHDLQGYPSLDPMIYQTFSRVMSQVEGGELMVIQRGTESQHRRPSDAAYRGSGTAGWNDGPWWRQKEMKRDLGVVNGLVVGTKLTRANAEAYADEFFATRGGVEEAAKQATQVMSDSNPVRSSDIFLAIQGIGHPAPEALFGGAPEPKKEGGVQEHTEQDDLVSFAIYLHDPIHSLSFQTVSQSIPAKWTEWLDAPTLQDSQLPDEIVEIVESGGVDPREWVAEWIEEIISLGVGVVAQRYVARRMGVGEGGIGRGKARGHVVEAGGGEAARAI